MLGKLVTIKPDVHLHHEQFDVMVATKFGRAVWGPAVRQNYRTTELPNYRFYSYCPAVVRPPAGKP
jgi:hypothetical protein